jgi:G:T-mismatch repair DNA endonuclease (very short patch repair protein)
MTRRHTKETILDKFKNIHGYRYDYSNVEYINNHTNVIIICEEHGKFQQSPASHLRGSGCSRCSRKCQGNTTDFLLKVKEIYTDKYDLSFVEYVNAYTKVKIICKIHGEFEQIPGNLMKGYSCPECTETKKKNTSEFLQKAKKVHGDEYDYSKVIYKNCNSKVEIVCKIHGSFFQQPRIHVNSTGCQKCNNFTTSKIARNWLKSLNIPHLRTSDDPRGEYRIPETKWKVDGYDEKTNTIYEFHGDYWHAHPSVSRYNENEKHPRKRGTWGEIYKNTLEREQKIRNLGYNLIVIWEHEFIASLNNYQGHSVLYTNL